MAIEKGSSMDESAVKELMELALKAGGYGWKHGLVIPSPRGIRLLSMSLILDSSEPNDGYPLLYIPMEPPSSCPDDMEITEVVFGEQRKFALLASTGPGKPEVVLFDDSGRADVVTVAHRFGGYVCEDYLNEHAKVYKVTADDAPPLTAYALVQEGVGALLRGAATETARAAEKAMKACGLVMGKDGRAAVMRAVTNQRQVNFGNLAGRALDAVSLCIHGDDSDEWSEHDDSSDCLLKINGDACGHVLHGIVTGAGDDAVVDAALGSMEREFDGIRVSPASGARAQMLAAVQNLRKEMTGSSMDPMAKVPGLPALG